MIQKIDSLLNTITMYRLMLYYLTFLVVVACVLGGFGLLAFGPLQILFSLIFIVFVCFVTNTIFGKVFGVPTNIESIYISAFILTLIITPPASWTGAGMFDVFLPLAFWASVLSMASKYILAINKKHIFNPVAVGVALCAIFLNLSATWWVGTAYLAPFVLVGGLLIVRKILRSDLVFGFLLVSVATIAASRIDTMSMFLGTFEKMFLATPLLFFAFVMITEPLTTPPTYTRQMIYGAFVGFLFAPALHVGSVYSTPELALLIGNILSYILSPKIRLLLTLKEKVQLSPDVYNFIFIPDKKMPFRPGQYLEWTVRASAKSDTRGNRRYFTVASSPTESEVIMGVKFYEPGSTFKQTLQTLAPGDHIAASQLAGDFVLPKDASKKLVFIAGGIGVTPFRSMVKYLIDTGEQRDVVLMYSNRTAHDIVYRDIFDEAAKVGVKSIYAVSPDDTSTDPVLHKSFITKEMILCEVPDYLERSFYISGPRGMVTAFEKTLSELRVPTRNIKTDFFPGFV